MDLTLDIPDDRPLTEGEKHAAVAKVREAYDLWIAPAETIFTRLCGSRARAQALGIAVLLGTSPGQTTNVEEIVMLTMRNLLQGAPIARSKVN